MDTKTDVNIFLTAKDTKNRLTRQNPINFHEDVNEEERNIINIYDDVAYQEIIGFGGAFTEAAAFTFYRLPKEKQEEILKAYFDSTVGLNYNFCRTHINSCDFSLGNYSYAEKPDPELKDFSIDHDKRYLIPLIKSAKEIAGPNLKIFASPWSPPAWMKTNGQMNGGGKLKNEYKEAWAHYYAKYIKAYSKEGIDICAITVQNEPKAVQTWDSCVYTAYEEKEFVKNYLGPILKQEGLENVKIMIWDHNKERLFDRAKVAFEDEDASKYIWGAAFHWYSGDHFDAIDATHKKWPNKKLISSESCVEKPPQLGSWDVGERYGHDMIGDLKNYTNAWVDWNILLDEMGGPNHVGNYCDAPIIADTRSGILNYETSYYYMGHFSKYILPGSIRIGNSSFTDELETVAFKTPTDNIVLIVMNKNDKAIKFNVRYKGMLANYESPAHSILTMTFMLR